MNDESQVLDLTPLRRSQGLPRKDFAWALARELTPADRQVLAEARVESPGSVGHPPALKRFRDFHHAVARCVASGMNNQRVHLQTGISLARLSTLLADPAFNDLVAVYRSAGVEEFAEYVDLATLNMIRAEREIERTLEAQADRETPLSLGELRPLTELIADRADRFGYPRKQVQANLNLNYGDRLEASRKRSGLLPEPSGPSSPEPEGQEPAA